ncbi:MAG: holo-ACP synthase [Micavibrio sp.]|nr:holo-ACP synthase [Micavibrio sp.]
MIIGIGEDLIDIRRIEKTLERFGERFEQRCFTDVERAKADRRADAGLKPATLAKRYAAKEACAKALGTGLAKGVFWKDIRVDNHPGGQPFVTLSARTLERLEGLTPAGKKAQIHISLTDEPPYALAKVIIEAV